MGVTHYVSEYHDHQDNYYPNFRNADGTVGYREGVRYFGIEIEMTFGLSNSCDNCDDDCDCCDGGNSSSCDSFNEDVASMYGHSKYDDMFYLEYDGSVDGGFELISEPLEFPVMVEFLKNCEFLKICLERAKFNNCGVHVHVSKPKDYPYQQRALGAFIAKTKDQLSDLTRDSRFAEWYNDSVVDEILMMCTPDGNLNDIEEVLQMDERYKCVNFSNENTIEYRFFNSTSNHDRLCSYIKFVNDSMDVSESNTITEIMLSRFTIEKNFDIIQEKNVFSLPEFVPFEVNSFFEAMYGCRKFSDIVNPPYITRERAYEVFKLVYNRYKENYEHNMNVMNTIKELGLLDTLGADIPVGNGRALGSMLKLLPNEIKFEHDRNLRWFINNGRTILRRQVVNIWEQFFYSLNPAGLSAGSLVDDFEDITRSFIFKADTFGVLGDLDLKPYFFALTDEYSTQWIDFGWGKLHLTKGE